MNYINSDNIFRISCIVITIIVISVILWLGFRKCSTMVEHYGGPIKLNRKIPMTDCYKICDYQYSGCRSVWPYDTIGRCEARQNACRSECYYSNVQRF